MRRSLRHLSIVLLGAVPACGTHQGVATQPVRPVEGLRRGAVTPGGLTEGGGLTVGRLQSLLMAHADRAMGEIARAGQAARAADTTPEVRLATQLIQSEVATTAVGLAVEPDPQAALLDLMVSTAAQRRALTGAGKALGPRAQDELGATLALLEADVWRIGAQVYGPTDLDLLRDRVDRWVASRSEASFPGVVRLGELPEGARATAAKGLLAPLDEANRQIEEGRMLGERFLFLAQRLPTLSRWQAEALTWEALGTPESRQALGGLALMSGTMARLTAQVESLPTVMLNEIDQRQGALRGLLHEAGTVTADGRALAESGERLLAQSKETAATLGETIRAADRLVASLRDASAPGGAASLDINQYTHAITELRAAAEALNTALATGQGVAGSSRGWVDHAAWRAAQLILFFFVLLFAYRWFTHLPARRST